MTEKRKQKIARKATSDMNFDKKRENPVLAHHQRMTERGDFAGGSSSENGIAGSFGRVNAGSVINKAV